MYYSSQIKIRKRKTIEVNRSDKIHENYYFCFTIRVHFLTEQSVRMSQHGSYITHLCPFIYKDLLGK